MKTAAALLIALASLVTGCEPDVIAPIAGTYQVEVEVLADDCTPHSDALPFTSRVDIDERTLVLELTRGLGDDVGSVADAAFMRTHDRRLEYARDPETAEHGPCMTVTRTTTVELFIDDYFTVIEEERWVRAAGCDAPAEPAGLVPAATCTAQRLFGFRLASP